MIFDWILATGLGAALFGKTISEQTNKELIMKPRLEAEKKIADAKAQAQAGLKEAYRTMYHHYEVYQSQGPLYNVGIYSSEPGIFFVKSIEQGKALEALKTIQKKRFLKFTDGTHARNPVYNVLYPPHASKIYILELMTEMMTEEEKHQIIINSNYNPPQFTERDFLTFGDTTKIVNLTERSGYGYRCWNEMPLVVGSPYAMYHQNHCIKSRFYLEHESDPRYERAAKWFNSSDFTAIKCCSKGTPGQKGSDSAKLHAVAATFEYFTLRGEPMPLWQLEYLIKYAGISEQFQRKHIVW